MKEFEWYEVYSSKELVPYTADGEYEQEAVDFARRNGVKMYVLAKAYDTYFADDRDERWIYKLQLVRDKKSYTFTFGQSINAGDTTPTYYDVLAALTKYDPYSFEDFCADYGYDEDSRKAYATFKEVQKEYNAVVRLFGDVMDDLAEIQGVGGVLWEYAIMECQQKGIDLNKDYFAQPSWVLSELSNMRRKFGYRQNASSKAMGRSENQSFYYSLCRHADKM